MQVSNVIYNTSVLGPIEAWNMWSSVLKHGVVCLMEREHFEIIKSIYTPRCLGIECVMMELIIVVMAVAYIIIICLHPTNITKCRAEDEVGSYLNYKKY